MKVAIIELPCRHLQEDGSKFYFALLIDNLQFKIPEHEYTNNLDMLAKLYEIKGKLET